MASTITRPTAQRLLAALAMIGALSLAGCAVEPVSAPAPEGDSAPVEAPEQTEADVTSFEIGQSASFEVFPELEEGNIAQVTINSATYSTDVDFEQYEPREPITAGGLLIINLTWETLEGSTQFNSQYVKVTLADGTEGVRLWENLDGRTKNGRVDIGDPHTGNMAFAIDSGATTIVITDHEFGDAVKFTLTT